MIERIKKNFKTKCGKTESTLQPVGELSVKKWRNLRNESGQAEPGMECVKPELRSQPKSELSDKNEEMRLN